MKECDIIQPELSAYLDGELTPHRREQVEEHFAACPRCQEALAELKILAAGVAELPKLPAPPRFLADVRRKIAGGSRPKALSWQDYLFRPFWIKIPLELAAVVAVTIFVTRLEERQPVETAASDQLARAENSGNDRSPSVEMEAKTEHAASTGLASAPRPPSPSVAPENEVATAPAGEPMSSQEAPAVAENKAESSRNMAFEAASGSDQISGQQAKAVVEESEGGIKSSFEQRRRVAAINPGTGSLGVAPTPSAAEVSTLARNVGVEPSRISGVVVVHSRDLKDVHGRAEQLAARCSGKVTSVSPSMGSIGQIFFAEVPREYAASFKLDLQQNAVSSTLSTNAMVAGIAVVATNGSPLSATSTARVVGVLTGGVDTNAIFDVPAQLALANNPRAQAAATTVLEILVVAPPSLAPTNITSVPATPAH
jgi:hypothetical protein